MGELHLTLPHEIFQVMPFHIVGEIPDVDSTFLLRRFSNRSHHLLLCLSTFLKTPRWRWLPASTVA